MRSGALALANLSSSGWSLSRLWGLLWEGINWMERIWRVADAIVRVLRSRLFAATALAVATSIMVTAVSVNVHAVTVIDGEDSKVVLTFHEDPQAVLAQAGTRLSKDDKVESDIRAAHGEISITRAFDVQVTADGVTTVVRMTEGAVTDALAQAGVEVGEQDTLNVAAYEPVSDGMQVVVERVQYKEYTKTEPMAYTSVKKYTNLLRKGATRVNQKGQAGSRAVVYRDRMVDGKVVETVKVSEKVIKNPVQEVVLVGTVAGTPLSKPPYEIELDEKGHPANYKKVFTGQATAYTNEGGRCGKYTASGRKAAVGVVAVDPRKIPYGTELYIVSADGSYVYGYAIAGDTGGACRNGLLTDLFFDTFQECRQFGRRNNICVYVLK